MAKYNISKSEAKRLGIKRVKIDDAKKKKSEKKTTTKKTTLAFKESAAYKSLSQEAKDFIDLSYNAISAGGEQEMRMLSNAITQAQAIADPYYKSQLAILKAEVTGKIAEQTQDFEARRNIIETTRKELAEDISRNKEFLTLEQQVEIGREIRSYDEDLLTIADQAAEKGITFATGARSRALAEERRATQYQDVIMSSQRKFNLQMKELELKAARGDTEAQKQLEDIQVKNIFELQRIGRSAEQVLGTAALPPITGYEPTGGIMGTLEEEKRKSVLSDIAGFTDLQKGII